VSRESEGRNRVFCSCILWKWKGLCRIIRTNEVEECYKKQNWFEELDVVIRKKNGEDYAMRI